MKILYVMRHAKSSWDNPALTDFNRPLNERGERDIPEMGQRLVKRKIIPDLIISSPAERAITTAIKIARIIQYPAEKIKEDKILYLAGVSTILAAVRQAGDIHNSLMIFGHNPGWTDFVNHVSDKIIDNIPTCGIAAISFDIDSWQQVEKERGTLLFFDYPKKHFQFKN